MTDKIVVRDLPALLAKGEPVAIRIPDVSDPIGVATRPVAVTDALPSDVPLTDPPDGRMTRDRWQLWFNHGDGFVPGLVTTGSWAYERATLTEVAEWKPAPPAPVEPEQRPAYVPDALAQEATEAGYAAGRTHAAWADGGDHPMHVTPQVPERFATVATHYTAAFDDAVTKYEEDSTDE